MSERALLFTDVVDSTRLVERLGDARAAEVWSAHDRRARELLARHRGSEIDRADGFFLLFDEARDAAAFALGYHDAIADLGLVARVGLHVGPMTLRENAAADVARGAKPVEVEGLAKPLAARVMALAMGGQCLLTAAARDAMAGALPEGARIVLHGHYRFKGIKEPVEVFEIGAGAERAFLPPPDADKAYRVVRSGDMWFPVREVRHNLPAERDTFVGRSKELRALAERLDAGARLVTVLGPGGTGKTRFVRRYGWTWLGDRPGGVYFCDLSEAGSLHAIHFAVAAALDVPLGRDDPAVQLGHAIAGRGRCLVILDNFEQVVGHAAATVGSWLDRAPGAAFVVTSRERLHLPGEVVFPLEPLPVDADGVELFALRARAQRPEFVLDDANARGGRRGRAPGGLACRSRSSSRRRACACSRRRNSSCACATASRSCPARAAWRRGRRRSSAPSTGRGICLRRGSRTRSRSARCSKADSRSKRRRRCSTCRRGPKRRPPWT